MAGRRRRQDQTRRRQDHYGRRAKRDGFPARSVYKLEEIDQKLRLLRRGMRVLDLGASPGSWTLYAAQKVAPEGKVLGLDIKPPNTTLPSNASIEVKDVTTVSAEELGGSSAFDVVLSDMAPSTTGHRATDCTRSFSLYMTALDLALRVTRPGGHFVGKIFQGEDFPEAQKAVRAAFREAKVVRPKATRDVSYEVFLCGVGRVAPEPPASDPAPDLADAPATDDEAAG